MTRSLLEEAAQRAIGYLAGLAERPVLPSREAIHGLERFDLPLADEPVDPREVLRQLDELGSPATVATAGPRFFGYVIGGSLPVAVAANWLATAWDQNAVFHDVSPAAATLERVAGRWLIDLFGLPETTRVGFVTGGSVANLTALAAARNAVYRDLGWDVDNDGMLGAPPVTVVVGEEAHPTLLKALGLLGFGRRRVLRVPVDAQGRMRPELMPRLAGPAIVCLQAGNVNTGSFDPFPEAIARAKEAGAWVHVDGAFGMWALASPYFESHTAGMTEADSWSTDGHKWLNVPYDCGLAFVRDGVALRSAMTLRAAYLPEDPWAPSESTPQLSRRARGVEVWAALNSLGRSGVAELVERCCSHARRFAERLSDAGYEVLNDVVLNQVLVSFGEPVVTRRVIQALQEEGTAWFGGTEWQGRTAMRISVCSWATTAEDVERSIDAVLATASDVQAATPP